MVFASKTVASRLMWKGDVPSRAGRPVVLVEVSAAEATPRQCQHDQWDQVGLAVAKASVVGLEVASEVDLVVTVAVTEASAAGVTLEAAEAASVAVSEEAVAAAIASVVVIVDSARVHRTATAHHQTHPTDRADPVAAVTEENSPEQAVGMVAVMAVAHMMTDPATAEVTVGVTAGASGTLARAAATWSRYARVTSNVVGIAAEIMTGPATTTAPGSVDTKATADTRTPGNCVVTNRTTSSYLSFVLWWVYSRLSFARLSPPVIDLLLSSRLSRGKLLTVDQRDLCELQRTLVSGKRQPDSLLVGVEPSSWTKR